MLGLWNKVLHFLSRPLVAVILAFFIRCLVGWYLPCLMDGSEVPYTDVDYHVFLEAAHRLRMSQNPYQKPSTYRYTPFLAALLEYISRRRGSEHDSDLTNNQRGRYLFCLADTLCGWIIMHMRQRQRRRMIEKQEMAYSIHPSPLPSASSPRKNTSSTTLCYQSLKNFEDAGWWLYNPLAINICTRGSAESLVVILPVLLTLQLAIIAGNTVVGTSPQLQIQERTYATWRWSGKVTSLSFCAGLVHGLAIHAKIYPVIYTLSYAAYFGTVATDRHEQGHDFIAPNQDEKKEWKSFDKSRFWYLVKLCCRRLLSSPSLIFVGSTALSFSIVSYLAVVWYGNDALQEAFMYHLSRVDHRHNYSMFWYWIYLAKARVYNSTTKFDPNAVFGLASDQLPSSSSSSSSSSLGGLGRFLLLPQAILLIVTSVGMAPYHLSLALFVQTYLFVTLNKVITAQYFCWYLCLLPLCSDSLQMTRRIQWALLLLGIAIAVWLGCAYHLEMKGLPFHRHVWLASIFFFIANINLLSALLQSYRITSVTNRTKVQSSPKLFKAKVKLV